MLRRSLVLLVALLAPASTPAFDAAAAARVLDVAHRQLTRTFDAMPSSTVTPHMVRSDGTWSTVSSTNLPGWTQGFYPGLLWKAYEATGDPAWRTRAVAWTRALEAQKTNTTTHDLGFKMVPSFGAAWRITKDPYYRDVLVASARSLATRYRPIAGVISCCDWNPDWKLPLVVDTMMNLELLLSGAANGGNATWRTMALSHARVTARELVRADGSTYHVVDFDPATGAVRFKGTYQGLSANSTWSRGEAWALYGFTMVYRYTRDAGMLAAARKVAGYWRAHVPADGVPNWDFDATAISKDSSAAAVAASGLLELAGFVADATEAAAYRALALRTLDTLSSSAYLGSSANMAILQHGTANYPASAGVNVGLVYGDYYFLEAVLRHTAVPPMTWRSRLAFASAWRPLGKGNGGVRTIEVDVTPRKFPLDGVVGWADQSTAVTGYPSLAMIVRLAPNGFFDVRNGATYGAAARVAYRSGATYHVRVLADLAAKRYSVWIRPPGGVEALVAYRYAFRSDAPWTDDVGKLVLRSSVADGEFTVARHRMVAGSTPIATVVASGDALPEQAPQDAPPEAPAAAGEGGCATGGGGTIAGGLLAVALAAARRRRGAVAGGGRG